ncbi:MAG: Major cardiolipin synthase ClsA [Phycisphaerae bacterium]|nr:Major cardiolipin synthase ClsA [Phycisphaerae bacterium]
MDQKRAVHEADSGAGAGGVGPDSGLRMRRLERLARHFSPRPRRPLPYVGGNDFHLLINGNKGFSHMLSAMLTARASIDIEMYIWRADRIGRRFADLLKAKAEEGVKVRVIRDAVGCFLEPRSFWREMSDAGILIAEFNPIAPWRARKSAGRLYRKRSINHRDHRKIILVDGEVAFTGGINIGDEYVGDGDSHRHWRDTSVQVRGPVVARLAALFERQWRQVTGSRMIVGPVRRPDPVGEGVGIVLDSQPWKTNLIHRTILAAVRRSRKRIEITMAYFMPPARLTRALRRAARRGVLVRLLLPAHSDVAAVFHAGRSNYSRLLKAGIHIYECQGTVLHAKTLQVDDVWGTVGSANLDMRSFRLNDEVNVFVLGRSFARQLHWMFESDLARSREITLEQWKRRPWLDKLKERFFRLFRRWL